MNPYDSYALLWYSFLAQWRDDPERAWRVQALVYWMDEVQAECLDQANRDDARALWRYFANTLPGFQEFWSSVESWKLMRGTEGVAFQIAPSN